VLFVINSMTGGGAERVMSTLLSNSEAEAAEFDITLALLDQAEISYPLPRWIELRQLDCGGSLTTSLAAVARLTQELRPVVSLSFLSRANVASVYAAHRCGHLAVVSERTTPSQHLGHGLRNLFARNLVRLAYPRASRVIAVSTGVGEDLATGYGVDPRRIVAIENPVDIASLQKLAAQTPRFQPDGSYIIAVGRLDPLKRFDMLIEAFATARPTDRLVILGEGPDRARLMDLARRHGVAERVDMPGFVTNPFAVVRRARLYVLCSDYEGFPNSLVEAMALGVPVVATNCRSGPSEILAKASARSIHGVTRAPYGVLTPVGSTEGLIEALDILADEATRQAYARAGRVRAVAFDVSTIRARYWNVIRDAIAASAQPARQVPADIGEASVALPS
jgi:N-acetylgalactosamine-N,N'-diacetylbacillosaminyl-diphospho-undecaprenol 4-alpha-N-acetylgalactosaminyltransferase